jgi:hypothetical protein
MPTEIKVRSIGGSGSTKNTITAKKSKIKSKDKQVTVETVKMVSGYKQAKSKLNKFIGSSSITKNTSNKNNIKKRPAYPKRSSLLSPQSPSKNSQKIGKKSKLTKEISIK